MTKRLWRVQEPISGEIGREARRLINPRRGIVQPVPGMDWHGYFRAKEELFTRFGLAEYADNVSGEMSRRPCPQVLPVTGKIAKLMDLMKRRGPALLAYAASQATAPTQTYNKVSRTGWPHFNRPVRKYDQARAVYDAVTSDPSILDESATFQNIRLQAEKRTKEREVQFVSSDGTVYDDKVTEKTRTMTMRDGRKVLTQRTRGVNNLNETNLICQVVDTAVNNFWGTQPVCHHNLYSPSATQHLRAYVRAVDVKHMERFSAAWVHERTQLIAGTYAVCHNATERAGYVVPSDDWTTAVLLREPIEGYIASFASGHSAVAPSQKEILIALYIELHVKVWGYTEEVALEQVLRGSTLHLHIMNFGDDNLISSDDPQNLDVALAFLGEYLDVEEEVPTKFLGFVLDNRRFVLSPESYLLKTWLHERAAVGRFRKKPFLGWVLKRQVYRQYGFEGILSEIFAFEDALLMKYGTPWSEIEKLAREEKESLSITSATDINLLLGKDYLLTAEEKVASGAFDGIGPEQTGPLLEELTAGGVLEKKWSGATP